VDEFPKEQLLAFEKEVLGIYISGHPLEEYESLWRKHITATTGDLTADEETGKPRAADESIVTLGGMVENPSVKYTRQNKAMAVFNLEDLVGSAEVLVFPKIYERYANVLKEDAKIFVKGRVSVEEESDAKLLAQEITLFDDLPRDIWIRFEKMSEYEAAANDLNDLISDSDGRDRVVIYVNESRSVKRLGARWSVSASPDLIAALQEKFGRDNVKVTWG
jgi:DNA polymerase-3 subunit alpha